MNASTRELSEQERKIIRVAQLQADLPAEAIAKKCGLKTRTVQTALRNLTADGVIFKQPIINFSAIGYQSGIILLEANESSQQVEQLTDIWKQQRCVRLVARLGATYTYCVSLVARDMTEVLQFLEETSTKKEIQLDRSQYLPMLSLSLLGTRALFPELEESSVLQWEHGQTSYKADELDLRILSTTKRGDSFVASTLSRRLGESASTISYRLNRLEDAGVIVDYCWIVNTAEFGFSYFDIFIESSDYSQEFSMKLMEFCQDSIEIDVISRLLGNPQYVLGAATNNHEQISTLVSSLKSTFRDSIASVGVIPVVRILPSENFNLCRN